MSERNRTSRDQVRFTSLENLISRQSMVRIIDAYINNVDMEGLGIEIRKPIRIGRSEAIDDIELFKLWIYGAIHQEDSSRDLEEACRINSEVQWLTYDAHPSHTRISTFRKEHIQDFPKLFYDFTDKVLGGKIGFQSLDGSKFHASNAKDKNYTLSKLDDRIKRAETSIPQLIDRIKEKEPGYVPPEEPKPIIFENIPKKTGRKKKEKAKETGTQLDFFDKDENESARTDTSAETVDVEKIIEILDEEREIREEEDETEGQGDENETELSLDELKQQVIDRQKRKAFHLGIRNFMEEKGLSQVSLTDINARLMKCRNGFMVSYNVQFFVDSNTHIISEYMVTTNATDHGQLCPMGLRLKKRYHLEILPVISDGGYVDKIDMAACLEHGIIPHVMMGDEKGSLFKLQYAYEETEVTEEMLKSTREEDLRKCLHGGKIPEVYSMYLSNPKIIRRSVHDTDIPEDDKFAQLTDEQRITIASQGYFVMNKSGTGLYCPAGELLRPKRAKKDGYTRYYNAKACGECKARKAQYCTKGKEPKTVDIKDGVTMTKCKNWPEAEFETVGENNEEKPGNQSEINETEAEETFEKKPKETWQPKPIKRKLIRKEVIVEMEFKSDRKLTKQRFGISEHPHGTMKVALQRESYNLRGIENVTGEQALTALAYNMIRAKNLLGFDGLMKAVSGKNIK